MGLFDKLFSFGASDEVQATDAPIFGRYSDNNKTRLQLEEWTNAEKYYEDKEYHKSIVCFFSYLRDDSVENVVFEPNNENAKFHIYQGSKKITGTIDGNCVRAEVSIAKIIKQSVPVMRQLLEKNFQLYYSKFYLEEDKIKLKIYNNIMAAAPNKLYYALKELSIQADRLDDILVDDFTALIAEGTEHIQECTEQEKQTKYDFFRLHVDGTISKIEALNQTKLSGGITYLILNLIFKLDYLLLPEGKLTQKLESINSLFWNIPKEIPATERNRQMMKELKELQAWQEEEVKKCFYNTKHTFALTKPTTFKNVIATIQSTVENAVWFQENDHADIAIEMLEYAIAYSQFSFSLPKPVTQLFDVMMQMRYADYYMAMGYNEKLYDATSNHFKIEKIKEILQQINHENTERYAHLTIDIAAIDFENIQSFYFSLLQEIIKLDLRKKK